MKPNRDNEGQKECLEVRGPGRQDWLVRESGHVRLGREPVERFHAHRRDVAPGPRGSYDLFRLLVGGPSQAAEAVGLQLEQIFAVFDLGTPTLVGSERQHFTPEAVLAQHMTPGKRIQRSFNFSLQDATGDGLPFRKDIR